MMPKIDNSDKHKKKPMPEGQKPRVWAGGHLVSFPVAKNASSNEFCPECGAKVGGCCPGGHIGNPCGKGKARY